ncbi:unnamed protein product [Pleuronectes platessa]|uniref:Uncharacterized protein n=1 Tax=Pleuronectes platessa TaxID=8262 RepID=A0A9N7Z7F7_PLEPL|nr:unnamed protein product [Pleuronectes platessa]
MSHRSPKPSSDMDSGKWPTIRRKQHLQRRSRRVWFGLSRVVHLAARFQPREKEKISPTEPRRSRSTLTYLLCGLRADKNNGYPV